MWRISNTGPPTIIGRQQKTELLQFFIRQPYRRLLPTNSLPRRHQTVNDINRGRIFAVERCLKDVNGMQCKAVYIPQL